jgi:hypothetical protein
MVVAPYGAHKVTTEWWGRSLDELRLQGFPVALLPVVQGWLSYLNEYAPIALGISDWGERTPKGAIRYQDAAKTAHGRSLLWMAPVAPQDMRPKDQIYWEAQNSLAMREMWRIAIEGNADWVHLITWNDYSEHTHIAPSVNTGTAYYSVSGYFTEWFRGGKPPEILCDRLFYFYRSQLTGATVNRQPALMQPAGGSVPTNDIEILVFLRSPAIVEIVVDKVAHRETIKSGFTALRVPARIGRPRFRVLKGTRVSLDVQGAWSIVDQTEAQDLLYKGREFAIQ